MSKSVENVSSNEKLSNIRSKYYGNKTKGLRNGIGNEIWVNDEWCQNYYGKFTYNNLHGDGIYFYNSPDKKFLYDGRFYNNSLEGYCQVFYHNATTFQGLFRKHERFGPGIFTYADGTEDVGFWEGFKLRRICVNLSHGLVPRIANTIYGKTKLLKYRNLVVVKKHDVNIAKKVLENLEADPEVLKKHEILYNVEVRNVNSLFYHKKLFDREFYGDEDCVIDIIEPKSDHTVSIRNSMRINKVRCKRIKNMLVKINRQLTQVKCLKDYLYYQHRICKKCCKETSEQHNETNDEIEPKLIPEDQIDQYCSICLCHNNQIESKSIYKDKMEALQKDENFFTTIKTWLNIKLETLKNDRDISNYTVVKKVAVKELLAWNNEEIFMKMLQHSFLNRKSEENVLFNVSTLISSERDKFAEPGDYEKSCKLFLTSCSCGSNQEIRNLLLNNSIHPDLCDGNGNSGMMIAAAKDNISVINELVDFGANVDFVNDENISPLILCLLRYLSVIFHCDNWENNFLPEIELEAQEEIEVKQWYPKCSFLSLSSNSFKESISDVSSTTLKTIDFRYIFDLNFKAAVTHKFSTAKKEKDEVKKCTISILDKPTKLLERIEMTISVLLQSGSDPNSVSVPFPPLLLAVFSGNYNIVELLLKFDADPNIRIDDGLNCLHVIASLPPSKENIKICELLLNFGCNPNVKTSPNHWSGMKLELVGQNTEIPDEGKNVLHVLCLRKDFKEDHCNYFKDLSKLLVLYNSNFNELYCGHTALSLAVLRGNLKLIQSLIETELINPYKVLGNNLGNVITVLFLKQYNNILQQNESESVLDLLVDLNVNPLHPINQYENSIAFLNEINKNHGQKSEFSKFLNQTKDKKKPKNIKLETDPLLLHLHSLIRNIIIKQIQIRAVRALYDFAEENMLIENSAKTLAIFLKVNDTLHSLKILFQFGEIEKERLNFKIMTDLLEFVAANELINISKRKSRIKKSGIQSVPQSAKHSAKIKADGSKATRSTGITTPNLPQNFLSLLCEIDFTPVKKSNSNLLPIGLDDPKKYIVCFNCFKNQNEELYRCPNCYMIYFCSEQCNKQNVKLSHQHPCNLIFYESEKQLHAQKKALGQICINDLAAIILRTNQRCQNRLQERKQLLLKMEQDRILAERKADIYGTKFLKQKKSSKTSSTLISFNKLSRKHQKRLTRKSTVSEEKEIRTVPSIFIDDTEIVGQKKTSEVLSSMDVLKTVTLKEQKRSEQRTENVKVSKRPCTCAVKPSNSTTAMRFITRTPSTTVLSKVKKIPKKYQYFMQLLNKYFPEVDFSTMLLPYACYSDGQLFYKFSELDFYAQTYSTG